MMKNVYQSIIIFDQYIYLFQIFYFLFGKCRQN